MFWENIKKEFVVTNLKANSEKEVFEELGQRMVNAGRCKDSFVKALEEREMVFPTGILCDDIGVAIPHTDSEHVNESTISIANLDKPVKFYHMGTNPKEGVEVQVQFIIMLAIAGTNHLDMLQKAIQLIQDKEVLLKLIAAGSSEEVIQIIKEKEMQNEQNN
ncbi:MAG: PTS sugar transporter subunit IIA [Anaerostipes sp.]|jgi:PTS system galactitol-specific IIA component|nr:PTS sugar transporter subunit IIA [Anaerostipes sp.]MDD3745636.1 PTS sugar transporter subunit IIA [Anaerostipes sp.]